MSETMAQNIFQSGFGSFQSIAAAKTEDIMAIPGYDSTEKADKLIGDAKALVEKFKADGVDVPKAPKAQAATEVKGGDAKSQAEERLKAELAAINKSEKTAEEAVTGTEPTE
jgi:transcription termination/antitermination protein NusA